MNYYWVVFNKDLLALKKNKKGLDLVKYQHKALALTEVIGKKTTFFVDEISRKFKISRLFTSIVIIPFFIAAYYLLLIKTPIYESTARVLIEKEEDKSPLNISLGFLGNSGPTNSSNTYLTQEFILSREMLEDLEYSLEVKKHYQSKQVDFISRLKHHPSQKDFLTYYQKKISAKIDPETNEINLAVQAFNAKDAQNIAREIIYMSKTFVNRVSNTVADKQFRFAKIQLKQSKQKLFDAGRELLQLQNKHSMLDPQQNAKVVSEVMAQLKGELVKKQTEYITYSAFMQPESSKLVALKEEIQALKEQIKNQNSTLLGEPKSDKDNKLNNILVDFEWMKLKLTFAQAEYQAAQQAYDLAKVNLAKQQNLLIEISPPNLPDEYEYPKKLYDLVNLFIFLVILFLLTKMVVIIVQEHID